MTAGRKQSRVRRTFRRTIECSRKTRHAIEFNMPTAPVQFRHLTLSDIPTGLRLCRHAGWNQLAADWELFLDLSPRACRAAVHQDQVVGTVTTVNYENRFAWIGMVLVDPQFRGQGIGTRLLEESLYILRDLPCARLDATPQGRPVYQRLTFVDEYGFSRMQLELQDAGFLKSQSREGHTQTNARPMVEGDFKAIAEIDRRVFGANRIQSLRWAFTQAPEYAWVIDKRSGIAGYCLGRHGFNFDQIGPICAPFEAIAKALLEACLVGTSRNRIILDPLHHSSEWISWLQQIGFVHQRPFTRMYRGENRYPGDPSQLWAIFGPELG
jgi:GNAT superfamily N-acetyltransferase